MLSHAEVSKEAFGGAGIPSGSPCAVWLPVGLRGIPAGAFGIQEPPTVQGWRPGRWAPS
jgi:hypothetical protein